MDINYLKQFEPIDGKWYINKELGSGAYGTVFEIERKDFSDMKAALKVISVPGSDGEAESFRSENYDMDEQSITAYFRGIVDEFIEEFRLMSQLKGQSNIVSYEDHDVVKRKNGIGWDIFIRMELLTPMNKYFGANTPGERDVIKLGIDICKALEVCQRFKIIHRDIKPGNIFISDTGSFKLGDFGVARTLEKTSGEMSRKGTYTYMAPEVYKGMEYGSNVDIYSLGIVMYKLLNNNLEPFRHNRTYTDGEEALSKRMSGTPLPKPANADGRLAEIVLKACSYSAKERYESPLIMRMELENILDGAKKESISKSNGEDADKQTCGVFSESVPPDTEEKKTVSDIYTEEKICPHCKAPYTDDMKTGFCPICSKNLFDKPSEIQQEQKTANTVHNGNIGGFQYVLKLFLDFWTHMFDYKGSIGRKDFWLTILMMNVLSGVMLLVMEIIPFFSIPIIAIWTANISICTRRLHDVGRSGHWQWLYLTVYGTVAVIVFMCMPSKTENNKYKENNYER